MVIVICRCLFYKFVDVTSSAKIITIVTGFDWYFWIN